MKHPHLPSSTICDRAREAKDPRFDGLFFTAVRSTGIYCRPVCPAPTPKSSNVTYYPTAAAAASAGYRPCLRCRPELSPGSATWGGEHAVQRALGLIAEGALDEMSIGALAARVGLSDRNCDDCLSSVRAQPRWPCIRLVDCCLPSNCSRRHHCR